MGILAGTGAWTRALVIVGLCGCHVDDVPATTLFGSDGDTGGATSTSVGGTGTGGSDGGPQTGSGEVFDVGNDTDGIELGGIPTSCAEAAEVETTLGCSFFAVDLDQQGSDEAAWPYAVVVANVQAEKAATVVIETKEGGAWVEAAGPTTIDPLDSHVFDLPDRGLSQTAVMVGGAYRITSDVPIAAYQFNPFYAAYTADASTLYPAESFDTIHLIPAYNEPSGYGAYVTVVAAHDGTVVEITAPQPTFDFDGSYEPIPAGETHVVDLDAGDVAEVKIHSTNTGSLIGTEIRSNPDHPVGVFTGHECATIGSPSACDHLEDQIPGLRSWGTEFVASRLPVREALPNPPEPSMWQILASEDDTTIFTDASPDVSGLPENPVTLDAGESIEFLASGTHENPGDFHVSADKPIGIASYMIGWGNLVDSSEGDPSIVHMIPTEQYLPRYVVMIPEGWTTDYLVLTRPAGLEIRVDGQPVDDSEFHAVGPSHEVGRPVVEDGVHVLEADQPFGVVVAGTRSADSYAYIGGASTRIINAIPEG